MALTDWITRLFGRGHAVAPEQQMTSPIQASGGYSYLLMDALRAHTVETRIAEWDMDPIVKREVSTDAAFGHRWGVYEELPIKDDMVRACLEQLIALILRHPWGLSIEFRRKADPLATAQMDFVRTTFDDLGFERVLYEALYSKFVFGFSVHELCWAEDSSGRATLVAMKHRHPKHFAFNDAGQLLFKSRTTPLGEVVPPWKVWVTRNHSLFSNPYGHSLMQDCYYASLLKGIGERFRYQMLQKFGQPWLHARKMDLDARTDMSESELAEMVRLLELMRGGQVLVDPVGWTIDHVPMEQDDADLVHENFIRMCNTAIARSMLTQGSTVMWGEEAGSSGRSQGDLLALASEHVVVQRSRELVTECQWLVDLIQAVRWSPSAIRPLAFRLKGLNNRDSTQRAAERRLFFDMGIDQSIEEMRDDFALSEPFHPEDSVLAAADKAGRGSTLSTNDTSLTAKVTKLPNPIRGTNENIRGYEANRA